MPEAAGMEPPALLEIAGDAARAGGSVLAAADALLRTTTSSEDHDVKIRADVAAEEAILLILRGRTGYPVLSEECGEVAGTGGYRWIIDPLDGTLNYQRGIPLCSVSVALWRGDEPVLGAVLDLADGSLYTGLVGVGAWKDGLPIAVSAVGTVREAVLFTGFPAQSDHSTGALMEFVSKVRSFRKVRLLGSAALSLAFVASGKGEAYAEDGIRIWDVAAGLALVQAAGGRVQTRPGSDGTQIGRAHV